MTISHRHLIQAKRRRRQAHRRHMRELFRSGEWFKRRYPADRVRDQAYREPRFLKWAGLVK